MPNISIDKVTNFIGVDISKDTIDVSIVTTTDKQDLPHFKLDNNRSGFRLLRKKLIGLGIRINGQSLIICESIGVYSKALLDYFTDKNILLCVESGFRIKRSLGIQRGKNDKLDAKRIACYALTHRKTLQLFVQPREEVQKLKLLLTNRERLLRLLLSTKTPLKALKSFYKFKEMKFIEKLNQQATGGIKRSVDAIENEIKQLIQRDEKLRKQTNLLTSIPGIGWLVASNFIAYTNEFSQCRNGKQLACYSGVAPFKYTPVRASVGQLMSAKYAIGS